MEPTKCIECTGQVVSTDRPNLFRCKKCDCLYTATDKGLVRI